MDVIHLLKCLRPKMLHPLHNRGRRNGDRRSLSISVPTIWAEDCQHQDDQSVSFKVFIGKAAFLKDYYNEPLKSRSI